VSLLKHAKALAWKDLQVEFRSREILYTMSFFAAMVVLLFSFAFLKQSTRTQEMIDVSYLSAGFIWIAVIFTGTLGLGRVFDRERETGSMRALLLAPIPRASIFLGKAVSIGVMIVLVELVVLPLVALFFNVPLFTYPLPLLCTMLLGTLGFSVVGSVFASMLLKTQSRDVLLPVVLYPILVPLFIAAIKSSTAMFEDNLSESWFWIRFLFAYDSIFLVASLWTFESLVIE